MRIDENHFSQHDLLMIIPEQSRAARGLLDWSQHDLAVAAGVGLSTVRDFEKGRRIPGENNLRVVREALEAAGVVFLDDDGDGSGVRLVRRHLENGAMAIERPQFQASYRSRDAIIAAAQRDEVQSITFFLCPISNNPFNRASARSGYRHAIGAVVQSPTRIWLFDGSNMAMAHDAREAEVEEAFLACRKTGKEIRIAAKPLNRDPATMLPHDALSEILGSPAVALESFIQFRQLAAVLPAH